MKTIKPKTNMREEKDPFGPIAFFFISKNRSNGNMRNHTIGSLTFYKAAGEDLEKAVHGCLLTDRM